MMTQALRDQIVAEQMDILRQGGSMQAMVDRERILVSRAKLAKTPSYIPLYFRSTLCERHSVFACIDVPAELDSHARSEYAWTAFSKEHPSASTECFFICAE